MKKLGLKIASLALVIVSLFTPSVCAASEISSDINEKRTVEVRSRLWELLVGNEESAPENEEIYLIPGGMIFGTRLKEAHLTVTEAAECKELQKGDKILSLNGKLCSTLREIKDALNSSGGKVMLKVERGGKEMILNVIPKEIDGEYKLGAILREGSAGIGTITYITPGTMEFGGLGHGIYEAGTDKPIEIKGGSVTGVVLGSVERGEAGKPGELTGILTDRTRGKIFANTDVGVFGKLDLLNESLDEPMPIAHRAEVTEGEAEILSTLKNGRRMAYKVEIFDIDSTSTGTKSFKIKVTDPALLAISGGIVRGMSGSPIIQDGKLVGAVTHVLINDPTSGYGIFIENMLNAAQMPMAKAS